VLHHKLGPRLGWYINKYVKGIKFNVKLIGADKKSVGYSSTSTNCSTLSTTSVVFFSTCFSSLESLVITDAGARSEKCLQKPRNVSLSPSPTITTHVNASKISHSMFSLP
jgi:hypothetical protein